MIPIRPRAILRRLKLLLTNDHPERFLCKVSGVIHVGANSGQERKKYRDLGLRVLWVEPLPDVFQQLKANVADYPDNIAVQALVTDRDGGKYAFNVADNEGQSSSILDLGLHRDVWPEIAYTGTIQLEGTTLASLLRREGVNAADYQALILDTQGAELLVLHGAESILHQFKYIQTEVADFDSYKGGCQLQDIQAFLSARNFREHSRNKFASRPGGGDYFDVLYERR
jgi:FkbM family methyltransferase